MALFPFCSLNSRLLFLSTRYWLWGTEVTWPSLQLTIIMWASKENGLKWIPMLRLPFGSLSCPSLLPGCVTLLVNLPVRLWFKDFLLHSPWVSRSQQRYRSWLLPVAFTSTTVATCQVCCPDTSSGLVRVNPSLEVTPVASLIFTQSCGYFGYCLRHGSQFMSGYQSVKDWLRRRSCLSTPCTLLSSLTSH